VGGQSRPVDVVAEVELLVEQGRFVKGRQYVLSPEKATSLLAEAAVAVVVARMTMMVMRFDSLGWTGCQIFGRLRPYGVLTYEVMGTSKLSKVGKLREVKGLEGEVKGGGVGGAVEDV